MQRVGVLAGLGPAAGADFYTRLIAATPAQSDQDHVPVLMWADPTVPDRNRAYDGTGEPVVRHIEAGLKALDSAGADFVVSPCNTIHIWLHDAAKRFDIELLSIISATVDVAVAQTARGASIGVLGTHPTLDSGIYTSALAERGRNAAVPDDELQEKVIEAIYLVKVGGSDNLPRARNLALEIVQRLVADGVQAVISGCTEISVVLADAELPVPLIDSTDALVTSTIVRCQAKK